MLTGVFLVVIMGVTSKRAPAGFAPLAIGLALTLIHLVSIPVTNTSVNPARSTGPAIFVADGWALEQLWMFWVAPILGGVLGGAALPLRPRGAGRERSTAATGLAIEASGPQNEGELRLRRQPKQPPAD